MEDSFTESGLFESPGIKRIKFNCTADEFEGAFGMSHRVERSGGDSQVGIRQGKVNNYDGIVLNNSIPDQCLKLKFIDDKKNDSLQITNRISEQCVNIKFDDDKKKDDIKINNGINESCLDVKRIFI